MLKVIGIAVSIMDFSAAAYNLYARCWRWAAWFMFLGCATLYAVSDL
jgi:hypothetical protein